MLAGPFERMFHVRWAEAESTSGDTDETAFTRAWYGRARRHRKGEQTYTTRGFVFDQNIMG